MSKLLNRISFEEFMWEHVKDGLEQKVYSADDHRIRLLRVRDTFKEDAWCTNGHVGFVLKGEMQIDFNGRLEHYSGGDGLWIEQGEHAKHKMLIEKGKTVELVIFEEVVGS